MYIGQKLAIILIEVRNMDNSKVGSLIRKLRKEHGLTQLQLAEKLHISDKTVSKWERGMGCPEVSLIAELSKVFEVDLQGLLSGELRRNSILSGNLKRMKFYVCPDCGNLVTAFTNTSVFCCGRKQKEMIPVKASEPERLNVEIIDNEYFITADHEMTKEHYISFVALITSDAVMLKKQYPQWDLQARIPFFAHGRLLWYCTRHGLFYQEI